MHVWGYPDSLFYRCAGLTAYNALLGLVPLKGGDIILVQGTGGVSMYVTITSSSCALLSAVQFRSPTRCSLWCSSHRNLLFR